MAFLRLVLVVEEATMLEVASEIHRILEATEAVLTSVVALGAIEALPLILVITVKVVMTLVLAVYVAETGDFHRILKKTVRVLMAMTKIDLVAVETKGTPVVVIGAVVLVVAVVTIVVVVAVVAVVVEMALIEVMTSIREVHVAKTGDFHQLLKKMVGVLMVKASAMKIDLEAAKMKATAVVAVVEVVVEMKVTAVVAVAVEMMVIVVAILTKFLEEPLVVVVMVVAVGG